MTDTFPKQCPRCRAWFNGDEHDKICADCFELAVEENEVRKRKIIAESNEY